MHLPDYPAPDQFAEAAIDVTNYLRGSGTVTNAHALHCGWVCLGFLQGIVAPCDDHPLEPVKFGSPPVGCKDKAELANCLEMMAQSSNDARKTYNFDWKSLITVLFSVLMELLKNV